MANFAKGKINNLIQGVSQQPQSQRKPTQLDECVNFLPGVAEGCKRRNPAEILAKLLGVSPTDAFEWFSPSVGETYSVVLNSSSIKVFDSEGIQKTVTMPSGLSYLAGASAREDLRFLSSGDYLFVVNTSKTVAMSTVKSPARPNEALIFIKQGNYATDYSVFINGTQVATLTTADNVVSQLKTTTIAESLRTQLVSALASFTFERINNVIYVTSPTAFTIKTQDSNADRNISSAKGTVEKITDLPVYGKNGMVVKVLGDSDTNADDYYVEFKTLDGLSSGNGSWVETVKPDSIIALDGLTMPHALTRNPDGTFTFNVVDWGKRGVGDSDTSKNPSFVGNKINNIFFHKGRLGLLSETNVILSQSSDIFSFFRETMLTVLDSDLMDVTAITDQIVSLLHAVSIGDDLILFGDRRQFTLTSSGNPLTNQFVTINLSKNYRCDSICRPSLAGRSILFSATSGDRTTIRELYELDSGRGLYDADNLTEHVPWFVPRVRRISVSSDRAVALAEPYLTNNFLYGYRWFNSNNERLQQAWFKWEFEGNVLSSTIVDDKAYLVINRSEGVFLEAISLNATERDTGTTVKILLDHRELASLTYNSLANLSTITFSQPFSESLSSIIAVKDGKVKEISTNDVANGATAVTYMGDLTGWDIYVGLRFKSWFRFSQFFPEATSSNGTPITETQGRLQLRKIGLNVSDTGYFKVTVRPYYAPATTVRFTGKTLGELNSTPEGVSIVSKRFEACVNQRNTEVDIEVHNHSWLPSTFLSASWEGIYAVRR